MSRQLVVEEFGFEVGEAIVEKAVVGTGGLQLLLKAPVVVGELANAMLERGAFDGEALGGASGVLGLQVAEPPEKDADPFALNVDLGVGDLEGVLGIEGALVPGRFGARVRCCLGSASLVALAAIAVITSLWASVFW